MVPMPPPPIPSFPLNLTFNYSTSLSSLNTSNFNPCTQVILFFAGVCILHTHTVHAPIPTCIKQSSGRFIAMIIGPISTGTPSLNSIVIFVARIKNGDVPWYRHRCQPKSVQDAISAHAIGIRIPNRFEKVIDERPFGWGKVEKGVPVFEASSANASTQQNHPIDMTLYTPPPLSRITHNHPQVFPTSSKLSTSSAILQLIYSTFQGYEQYEVLIRNQGLSSPFIVALPYLYMSFINLVANLVQGSYSHVTAIPPSTQISSHHADTTSDASANTSNAVDRSPQQITEDSSMAESNADAVAHPSERNSSASNGDQNRPTLPTRSPHSLSEPIDIHGLATEFDEWLWENYPQLQVVENSSLETIAYFLHFTTALIVIVVCVGLFTHFQPGKFPSDVLLLVGVITDPILHIFLALAQRWERRQGGGRIIFGGWGAIVTIKLLAWSFHLMACWYAGKGLYRIYAS